MARVSFIALLVLALSCAACVSAAKVVRDGTLQWTLITQALQKGGQHSTYLSIVKKAGTKWITDYLSTSTTGFTCLVPSNAAFKVQKATILGYSTFRTNGQIQKYQGAGKTISLGPQFAQQGTQLANITKVLFQDPTAICYEISNVLVPLK
ncbi:unnamed protein product [Closterium sp. Naga37s-1]|nr:unnamed protein product [Closterium sp. Naga37s-1]